MWYHQFCVKKDWPDKPAAGNRRKEWYCCKWLIMIKWWEYTIWNNICFCHETFQFKFAFINMTLFIFCSFVLLHLPKMKKEKWISLTSRFKFSSLILQETLNKFIHLFRPCALKVVGILKVVGSKVEMVVQCSK